MIFVTVGTQLPFDRLIRAIDEIAPSLNERIVAQVNHSSYVPLHLECRDYLCADEFNALFDEARLILSHAGTGTILSALMREKPIIIMPRLFCMGEHRNDHQLATAMKMNELHYVNVAYDKKQLHDFIRNGVQPLRTIGEKASEELVHSLTDFMRD